VVPVLQGHITNEPLNCLLLQRFVTHEYVLVDSVQVTNIPILERMTTQYNPHNASKESSLFFQSRPLSNQLLLLFLATPAYTLAAEWVG